MLFRIVLLVMARFADLPTTAWSNGLYFMFGFSLSHSSSLIFVFLNLLGSLSLQVVALDVFVCFLSKCLSFFFGVGLGSRKFVSSPRSKSKKGGVGVKIGVKTFLH